MKLNSVMLLKAPLVTLYCPLPQPLVVGANDDDDDDDDDYDYHDDGTDSNNDDDNGGGGTDNDNDDNDNDDIDDINTTIYLFETLKSCKLKRHCNRKKPASRQC